MFLKPWCFWNPCICFSITTFQMIALAQVSQSKELMMKNECQNRDFGLLCPSLFAIIQIQRDKKSLVKSKDEEIYLVLISDLKFLSMQRNFKSLNQLGWNKICLALLFHQCSKVFCGKNRYWVFAHDIIPVVSI